MSEAEFSGFGDFFSKSVFLLLFRTQVQLLAEEVSIIVLIIHLDQFYLSAKRQRKQRPAHITRILLSFGRKFGHMRKERNIALQNLPNLEDQESKTAEHTTGTFNGSRDRVTIKNGLKNCYFFFKLKTRLTSTPTVLHSSNTKRCLFGCFILFQSLEKQ